MDTKYHQKRKEAREKQDPEKGRQSMPFRYVFVLTNLCNLRCSFCFQDKKYTPGSLTVDDWKKVADQLPFGAHITLTGGEPLLFKGFEELVLSLRKDITFNVICNGLLLDAQKSRFLLEQKNLRVLSVSIDDVGNNSRDFTPQQWELIKNNILEFKSIRREVDHAENVVLDIKSVIHGGNIDQILPLAKFSCNQMKADTHVFMFLKGSPMQHSDIMFDYGSAWTLIEKDPEYDLELLYRELEKLKSYIHSSPVKTTKYYLHPKLSDLYENINLERIFDLLDKPKHLPESFKSCRAPWESVHINNDGNVFPCLSFSIGNVKKEQLTKIIDSELMRRFKSDLEKCGTLPGCKQCGYLLPA